MPEELNEDNHMFSEDYGSWQDEVLKNCRVWLETVAAAGAAATDRDIEAEVEAELEVEVEAEPPDLYSFYEELSILRGEFRKNSRRSHETFAQIGESLDRFQGVLAALGQRLEGFAQEREAAEILSRQGLFLRVAELHERLRRLHEKLREFRDEQEEREADRDVGNEARPGGRPGSTREERKSPESSSGWWSRFRRALAGAAAPPPAPAPDIPVALIEGIFLTISHFEDFLSREGLTPIPTQGLPFDPVIMTAAGTVATDVWPPDTVYEEIAAGYLYRGQVLKPALVTVTVAKKKQTEE